MANRQALGAAGDYSILHTLLFVDGGKNMTVQGARKGASMIPVLRRWARWEKPCNMLESGRPAQQPACR